MSRSSKTFSVGAHRLAVPTLLAVGLAACGGGGGSTVSPPVAASEVPSKQQERTRPYALTDSGYNYSDQELDKPLGTYLGVAPFVAGGPSEGD